MRVLGAKFDIQAMRTGVTLAQDAALVMLAWRAHARVYGYCMGEASTYTKRSQGGAWVTEKNTPPSLSTRCDSRIMLVTSAGSPSWQNKTSRVPLSRTTSKA